MNESVSEGGGQTAMGRNIRVLVVEDGDEYLTNLTTFVADGMEYVQAKSGAQACLLVKDADPDLVYLDMRFDRVADEDLIGDLIQLTGRFNGDVARARRFQQDNQGLFILRALREAGFRKPVILSYDFSGELRRFAALSDKDPGLSYCPDYADAKAIRNAILQAMGLTPA